MLMSKRVLDQKEQWEQLDDIVEDEAYEFARRCFAKINPCYISDGIPDEDFLVLISSVVRDAFYDEMEKHDGFTVELY